MWHLPAIAPIIQETCREFNLPYHIYGSFSEALASHFRHIKAVNSKSVPDVTPT
jgi:linoleoyl-CoA desaturase